MSEAASACPERTVRRRNEANSAQARADPSPWSRLSQTQQATPVRQIERASTVLDGTVQISPEELLLHSQIGYTSIQPNQPTLNGNSKAQNQTYFCWQHGCQERSFTNLSNYRRHCREQGKEFARPVCPGCGKEFLREMARDNHFRQKRCKVVAIDANGVPILAPLGQNSARH